MTEGALSSTQFNPAYQTAAAKTGPNQNQQELLENIHIMGQFTDIRIEYHLVQVLGAVLYIHQKVNGESSTVR